MVWQQWLLVSLTVLSTLIGIARVGAPRTPITPGEAAFITIFNGLIVLLIVTI